MFQLLQPVSAGTKRPLWSVMIPTYNCAHYLRETLESVLIQDPGPELMQIEVIDDSSSDDPEAVVEELGKGRVVFYRQPQNVGHIKNFEMALERSKGRFIHLLHGDDRVLWGFYRQMGELMENNPEAGAAFCRHYFIDEKGDQHYLSPLLQPTSQIFTGFFEYILQANIVQTPSIIVKREVYESIGMFDHRLIFTEDFEMWVRIGKHYPVIYCKTPLAEYRNYNGSHTIRTLLNGKAWGDQLMLYSIIKEHNQGLITGLRAIHSNKMAETAWYDIQTLLSFNKKKEARELMLKAIKLPVTIKQKLRLLNVYLSGIKKVKRDGQTL